MPVLKTYRERKITVTEEGRFSFVDPESGGTVYFPTLAECQTAIDRTITKKPRREVIVVGGYGSGKQVRLATIGAPTVRSAAHTGRMPEVIAVYDGNKEREQVYESNCVPRTPENMERRERILQINAQLNALEGERSKLIEKMERFPADKD